MEQSKSDKYNAIQMRSRAEWQRFAVLLAVCLLIYVSTTVLTVVAPVLRDDYPDKYGRSCFLLSQFVQENVVFVFKPPRQNRTPFARPFIWLSDWLYGQGWQHSVNNDPMRYQYWFRIRTAYIRRYGLNYDLVRFKKIYQDIEATFQPALQDGKVNTYLSNRFDRYLKTYYHNWYASLYHYSQPVLLYDQADELVRYQTLLREFVDYVEQYSFYRAVLAGYKEPYTNKNFLKIQNRFYYLLDPAEQDKYQWFTNHIKALKRLYQEEAPAVYEAVIEFDKTFPDYEQLNLDVSILKTRLSGKPFQCENSVIDAFITLHQRGNHRLAEDKRRRENNLELVPKLIHPTVIDWLEAKGCITVQ